MTTPTVAQALRAARSSGIDRLDAQLLLATALDRPRSWLIAHGEALLAPAHAQRFATWCDERASGVPVAYLLGVKEFHGLTLHVNRDVLVPRPDTETLVEWALELLKTLPPRALVLDLGTGSGAIAIAIAHARPEARVCATDFSAGALEVARANGDRLGLAVQWVWSDWWGALGGRRFDLVLANPPYIADADPYLAALAHEPQLALRPGGDGLGALRTIAAGAAQHLHEGGWLLLEHGYDQAGAVQSMLHANGLHAVVTRSDLSGQPRCTAGQWIAAL